MGGIVKDLAFAGVTLVHLVLRTIGLSRRYPFKVRIEGSPLWCTRIGSEEIEEIGGFYATRFVMAEGTDEARGLAIELLRLEAATFARNPPDAPIRYVVDACDRREGVVTTTGAGFSFWSDREDEDRGHSEA